MSKGRGQRKDVKGKMSKETCLKEEVREKRAKGLEGKCYLAGADIGRRTYSIS